MYSRVRDIALGVATLCVAFVVLHFIGWGALVASHWVDEDPPHGPVGPHMYWAVGMMTVWAAWGLFIVVSAIVMLASDTGSFVYMLALRPLWRKLRKSDDV